MSPLTAMTFQNAVQAIGQLEVLVRSNELPYSHRELVSGLHQLERSLDGIGIPIGPLHSMRIGLARCAGLSALDPIGAEAVLQVLSSL